MTWTATRTVPTWRACERSPSSIFATTREVAHNCSNGAFARTQAATPISMVVRNAAGHSTWKDHSKRRQMRWTHSECIHALGIRFPKGKDTNGGGVFYDSSGAAQIG